jgi:hypothetical protein
MKPLLFQAAWLQHQLPQFHGFFKSVPPEKLILRLSLSVKLSHSNSQNVMVICNPSTAAAH